MRESVYLPKILMISAVMMLSDQTPAGFNHIPISQMKRCLRQTSEKQTRLDFTISDKSLNILKMTNITTE